ncbi:hypothetical protein B0I72DRAFT_129183 [Yarrowia lipolytica]|nr:hypothetical protein BKA91DRAFT_130822 [Yarrowia lipolytica]KAE8169547.1 hypothetical protein BKA90DRAFT_131480 [Yarrowia lipolytica]RDW26635.1 hypothetical protein B0I71DRAFT_139932 [Yarrowia lipolytica]RDW32402.1 hypothetical protein B0I72DRAFT_129183 [Yarrowia lipolytica]RDW41799.1 hypothetical protein B0I73DRAFT_138656 [Yarrowia lipolytica]
MPFLSKMPFLKHWIMDDKSDYEALTKRGRLVVTLQTWDHLAAHVITSQYKDRDSQQVGPSPPGGAFARKRYQLMCQLVGYPTTQQFDQPIEKSAQDASDDDVPDSEEDLAMTWD